MLTIYGTLTDEELITHVEENEDTTPLEQELAVRLGMMRDAIYALVTDDAVAPQALDS